MALNQAQYEAGSFSSRVGGKGKQVHFSTERLPGGIARVLCSPFWGRDTALSQGRIQLPFLGIMALIPLVPLCSLEKENSMVAPSLRSQGMVLRFSDNIFHLFSGVSKKGKPGYGIWFSAEIPVYTEDSVSYRRASLIPKLLLSIPRYQAGFDRLSPKN